MKMDIKDTRNEGEENDLHHEQKISIRFVLAAKQDPSLAVPPDAIAIPSSLRRKGLSTLVNHLLGRNTNADDEEPKEADDEEPKEEDDEDQNEEDELLPNIKFDFILNGKLLRMSVEAAVRRDGLSLEEVVEIQYFSAQKAPSTSGQSETLPDWVSALRSFSTPHSVIPKDGFLFCGCYDGTLRVLNARNCEIITSTKVHTGAIKCVDVRHMTSTEGENDKDVVVVTGSMDQTLLTQVVTTGKSGKTKLKLHGVYIGGHQNGIESVAMTQTKDESLLLASGDWDGTLCLWKIPSSPDVNADAVTDGASKKQKTSAGLKKSLINVPEISPICALKAHAANLSGMAWGVSHPHLITSSWDHSAKVWDVERQESILSLVGSRVVSAMDRCVNSNIIATGHPDCTVRLWDMRVDTKQTSSHVNESNLKPSHKAWVSSLKWCPTEPYRLATSSHDGTVKMWDIRSSLPLHSARAQEKGQKCLSVEFASDGHSIYSGGSDCKVKKFSC